MSRDRPIYCLPLEGTFPLLLTFLYYTSSEWTKLGQTETNPWDGDWKPGQSADDILVGAL